MNKYNILEKNKKYTMDDNKNIYLLLYYNHNLNQI